MQKTHSLHETSSRVSNKLPQLENGIIPESVQSSATCYTQMREVLSHKSSRRPRHPMMTGHKKLFLDFYDIKGAAKFNFFVLHELKQTPTEKVRDFFTRV